ncbi:MAG: HAMP domain-containing sensor histidine kinase [Bacilli bacterium]|nr:HAMP domain-containing sensor histidine kinase [Bacilli bacterium]
MKLNLKLRLTMSYIIISIFLVLLLYIVSNYFFQKQFQTYILEQQDIKNEEIKQVIINAYSQDGTPPSSEFLKEFGDNLLEKNLILSVYDKNDVEIFCISCIKEEKCNHALKSAEKIMDDIYPNFNGEYIERKLAIEKNDRYLGYISIGYYGPFFFNESDKGFVSAFNNVFILIAILSFIISIVLGVFSANKIANPIKKVIKKTKDISDGDYSGKIELNTNTKEIDELANSVNVLTNNLNNQLILKKQMASDFTHEFLTPLTAIQSSIDAIMDGIFEPTNDRLAGLKLQSERLSRMVFEIDKLVSVSNETLKLEKTKFDISEIIQHIIKTFETEIYAKKLQIRFVNNPVFIYASKDKISQVIINLLSNAIKYTNNNGIINIKINKLNDNIIFSIEDNGIGIAKKDLPYIFEYLYRADKSRDRNTGGSGIGLYVVKSIIEAHDGKVEVSSKINNGTKFMVTLPSDK